MFFNQCRPQPCQPLLRMRCNQQLIGIRASFWSDRDRFAAPDQFCPAAPKTPPAPHRALARIALSGPIPALHRLDGDAVSDFDSAALDRKSQWRIRPASDLVIA